MKIRIIREELKSLDKTDRRNKIDTIINSCKLSIETKSNIPKQFQSHKKPKRKQCHEVEEEEQSEDLSNFCDSLINY